MTNESSFGQRIAASWRSVAGHLLTPRSEIDGEAQAQRARRRELRQLGRRVLAVDRKEVSSRDGCLGAILVTIEQGTTKRDEIIKSVARHHVGSFPLIAYLLGAGAEDDSAAQLWIKRADGEFAPLPA